MIDIDTMEAGEEFDALFAEHGMGWTWINYPWWGSQTAKLLHNPDWSPPHGDDFNQLGSRDRLLHWDMPQWSTGTLHSIEVLHSMTEDTYTASDGRTYPIYTIDIHMAGDSSIVTIRNQERDTRINHVGMGALPLAICRAVYKVKTWEMDNG